MIKKTVKYVDFNGNERIEDCYFNLTLAEISLMELSVEGGYVNNLEKIVKSGDPSKIIETFRELLLKSYGIKSEDGRRFIKSDEISKEFEQTEAFSEVFMDLAMNEESAEAFVNGVIPEPKK